MVGSIIKHNTIQEVHKCISCSCLSAESVFEHWGKTQRLLEELRSGSYCLLLSVGWFTKPKQRDWLQDRATEFVLAWSITEMSTLDPAIKFCPISQTSSWGCLDSLTHVLCLNWTVVQVFSVKSFFSSSWSVLRDQYFLLAGTHLDFGEWLKHAWFPFRTQREPFGSTLLPQRRCSGVAQGNEAVLRLIRRNNGILRIGLANPSARQEGSQVVGVRCIAPVGISEWWARGSDGCMQMSGDTEQGITF